MLLLLLLRPQIKLMPAVYWTASHRCQKPLCTGWLQFEFHSYLSIIREKLNLILLQYIFFTLEFANSVFRLWITLSRSLFANPQFVSVFALSLLLSRLQQGVKLDLFSLYCEGEFRMLERWQKQQLQQLLCVAWFLLQRSNPFSFFLLRERPNLLTSSPLATGFPLSLLNAQIFWDAKKAKKVKKVLHLVIFRWI